MKRVLLKLSGEFLQDQEGIWSSDKIFPMIEQLQRLHAEGFEMGIVVGGGNIFRGGKNHFNLDRPTADGVGMAATCINALFLQACCLNRGLSCHVYGDFLIGGRIKPFDPALANKQLQQGDIVIFSGGSGHPFFSTDTAAALKALEIHAEMLLKGTLVDGVYDKDPHLYPEAKKQDHLTYQQALEGRYQVMDACAFALCAEQKMPIFVFNLSQKDGIYNAVHQSSTGTLIKG